MVGAKSFVSPKAIPSKKACVLKAMRSTNEVKFSPSHHFLGLSDDDFSKELDFASFRSDSASALKKSKALFYGLRDLVRAVISFKRWF